MSINNTDNRIIEQYWLYTVFFADEYHIVECLRITWY